MKALAMHRRWAKPTEGCQMHGGPVGLVLGETISGELAIEIDHHLVSRDFGNDRGSGYVQRAGVATSEGELSQLSDCMIG